MTPLELILILMFGSGVVSILIFLMAWICIETSRLIDPILARIWKQIRKWFFCCRPQVESEILPLYRVSVGKVRDAPPAYEDLFGIEQPPPAYEDLFPTSSLEQALQVPEVVIV